MINFTDVTKVYDKDQIALDQISFTIEDSYLTGIVGHNGAGKTTLFMIGNGLASCSSGEVEINGTKLSKNRRLIQKSTSLFTDKMNLYPLLTVKECLNFFIRSYGMGSKRYDYICSLFSLKSFENKQISKLSTGMLKKVMLAVSIVHNPSVLYLDEPFSGLDPEAKKDFIKVIRSLNTNRTMQIIISSHDLTELESLVDYLIVLKNGKLIEEMPVLSLMKKYFRKKELIVSLRKLGAEDSTIIVGSNGQVIKPISVDSHEIKYELDSESLQPFINSIVDYSLIKEIIYKEPSLNELYFKINSERGEL